MAKKKKKVKAAVAKDCLHCDCCIPIGEGDHWCDETTRDSSFDPDDMTKMFMGVEKLEPIPIHSIFDSLTEKQQAEARQKGERVARFWNFVHATKRFFRGCDNK